MFERFTDRSRRAIVLAQEEARILNHSYIGTEHLLLGLLREGEGLAGKALASLGITLDAVRQQVAEIIGRGQQPPSGHIPFTPRAKKVLELSAREADALGHSYIGTEHLLLGLLREGKGVAVQILVKLGADVGGVRDQVLQLVPGPVGQDMADEPRRVGTRARSRLAEEALARINSLDSRLASLERWVGMRPDLDDLDDQIAQLRRENEAAIDRQDFEAAAALRDKEKQLIDRRDSREKEWPQAAAGRPSLAGELARVNAELERLQAILREHGIEPGDGAA
jgi:ATP-dependent Clp protease ATP-binding subunit ClpC